MNKLGGDRSLTQEEEVLVTGQVGVCGHDLTDGVHTVQTGLQLLPSFFSLSI